VILRLLVLLLSVGLVADCSDRAPIAIGFIGGLSGHAADLGNAGLNGARLAIEAQNRKGGVNGHPLLLLPEDDRQNPESGRAAFARLADRGVAAIIGPMTSAIAVAVKPLADEKRLLLVSPTVTTRQLAATDDYFVRVIADSRIYAEASARFHVQKRHIKNFAILYDSENQAYADSWSEDFRAALEERGGKVLTKVAFRSTATADYAAQARQVLASGPEAILLLGSAVDTALMSQQIRVLDDKVLMITSEWAATERLISLGGAAVEGIFTAQFIDRESEQPDYQSFRRLFLERYQQEPGFGGIAGYDAAGMLITGLLQRRKEESVRDAILRIADFKGLQSPIHIDRFGDSTRPTYITVIRNGKFMRMD
jgi:branched-chain amino acid transport system substrate-binding protein